MEWRSIIENNFSKADQEYFEDSPELYNFYIYTLCKIYDSMKGKDRGVNVLVGECAKEMFNHFAKDRTRIQQIPDLPYCYMLAMEEHKFTLIINGALFEETSSYKMDLNKAEGLFYLAIIPYDNFFSNFKYISQITEALKDSYKELVLEMDQYLEIKTDVEHYGNSYEEVLEHNCVNAWYCLSSASAYVHYTLINNSDLKFDKAEILAEKYPIRHKKAIEIYEGQKAKDQLIAKHYFNYCALVKGEKIPYPGVKPKRASAKAYKKHLETEIKPEKEEWP